MSRPPHLRRIDRRLETTGFRPIGEPVWTRPVVILGLDGLEALRLADLEGLYQEAAAERMGVSRPTFTRIIARARAVVADALVNGKVLLVADEGQAVVGPGPEQPIPCPVHWGGRRRGRGCRCRGEDEKIQTSEPTGGPSSNGSPES